MTDNSIDDIYDEISRVLKNLKIKESKEYFDIDNVPDSLADNTFMIKPVDISESAFGVADTRIPLFPLKGEFKINLSYKLPANNIIAKMKSVLLVVESIIKNVLVITVGQNEKDSIKFNSANHTIEKSLLIYEISFDVNYRIKNI